MKARRHSFDIGDLSVNEIAYIAGGKQRVTNTVIISLIERGFLYWNKENTEKCYSLTVLKNDDGTLTENENLFLGSINKNQDKERYYKLEIKNIQDRLEYLGVSVNDVSIFLLISYVLLVGAAIIWPFYGSCYVIFNIICNIFDFSIYNIFDEYNFFIFFKFLV